MSQPSFSRSMKLSDAERRRLLRGLKGTAAATGEKKAEEQSERRQHERHDYEQSEVQVTVHHPGGSVSHLLVQARNISAGGLAFLHAGYLHIGTRCDICMPRGGGEPVRLVGVIVNMRHIDGAVHEFGVRFDGRGSLEDQAA